MSSEHKDSIPSAQVAILDAGAQYGKVIDRRIRELSVHSELVPLSTPAEQIRKASYSAIIISGGPESVYGPKAPKFDPELFKVLHDTPIMGICYGMQLMNYHFGGKVEKGGLREDGQLDINILDPNSPLFEGVSTPTPVLLTHGDSVSSLSDEFQLIAQSVDGIPAAIQHKSRPIVGVQFHPEVDLSLEGKKVLANFLFKVAKIEPKFTLGSRKAQAIEYIRNRVGDSNVLVLVSGGVDSTVCAALLHEALGKEKIYSLHVDSGFMRLNESDKVAQALNDIGISLHVVKAGETFFNSTTLINGVETDILKNVLAPETKRKIIGDTFMKVSEEEVKRLGLIPEKVFLAQGTLRPDLIESASEIASKNAEVIKTHHNDTQLVRELRRLGRIVEPLQDYHKDEVRALGEELGLPHAMVWRQPFPGPGLAIRIICADTPFVHPNQAKIVEDLKQFWTPKIKAHLLPARTVGVQGDGRSYSSLVGLFGEADWDTLFKIAKAIPKTIHQVNRVVYVFSVDGQNPCPDEVPYTITPTRLLPEEIEQLQLADNVVNEVLYKHDLVKSLSQVPVILFPADFGETGRRSIAIRTFMTNDFMTGVPAKPGKDIPLAALSEMVGQLHQEVPLIARVVYDLTSKPPGTTEWE